MPLAYGPSAVACLPACLPPACLPAARAFSLLPCPSSGCVRRDNNGGAQPPGPRPRLVERVPRGRRRLLRRPAPPCGGPGPRSALLPAAVPGGDGARAGVSLIAASPPPVPAALPRGQPPAAALAPACGRLRELGSPSRRRI